MNTSIRRKIEEISQNEANCRRLMSVPGVGPLISTAMVAACLSEVSAVSAAACPAALIFSSSAATSGRALSKFAQPMVSSIASTGSESVVERGGKCVDRALK
ncbi:hypothetical protein [Rhizobium mongolense]